MFARYLIRLDDANHFFDEKKWLRLEKIFENLNIKPIVAVIPKNKDPELKNNFLKVNFWETVRRWQSKGWSIAMHGFEHQFHEIDRRQSIVPLHDRSEFVGLELKQQRKKIKNSLSIFKKNSVFPSVWVAPAHSFDSVTLDALTQETQIRTISDGLSIFPFKRGDFLFVPQQTWTIQYRLFGVWTICLHPETMNDKDFDCLYNKLKNPLLRRNMTSLQDIADTDSDKKIIDKLYSFYFWQVHKLKQYISSKY
ncbi:DUF2334 domain-containing protein [Alphaproteobacteria bacterium]|nr:DUF2334 domain-containing protein [Alphaproteobacteria bacterium]